MKAKAARIRLWRLTDYNGDWFLLFAYTRKQAVELWRSIHEHHADWKTCCRVDDSEQIEVDYGCANTQTFSAADWCEGERPGPFASNTYEV